MSETQQKAEAAIAKAKELVGQHEKLFADHDLPLNITDQVLAREDLGDEARSKLESELAASAEAAREKGFADAREGKSHHKPHRMI